MTDRILLAALNNARWCDAVCRTYGLRTTIDERAWSVPTRLRSTSIDAAVRVDRARVMARL